MSRTQDFENEFMDFLESLGVTFIDENGNVIKRRRKNETKNNDNNASV